MISRHGYISYHKRKIEEAKNECSRAPSYKKYICIGTAAKVTKHGLAIGGLHVAHGTAKAVLKAARFFLKGVQALIKVSSPNDLTTILILLCSMNLSICPFSWKSQSAVEHAPKYMVYKKRISRTLGCSSAFNMQSKLKK